MEVGIEGKTGTATGIHLHVELCNLSLHNWQWPNTYNKDDYLDPTIYMGIDNIEGTHWKYDGTPTPTPGYGIRKNKYKFILFKRRRN